MAQLVMAQMKIR